MHIKLNIVNCFAINFVNTVNSK